jgi:hypothetical protein
VSAERRNYPHTEAPQKSREEFNAASLRSYLSWVPPDHARDAHSALNALLAERERMRQALDFIASDATITPEGCPEPWRSTLIEWAQAANHALGEES